MPKMKTNRGAAKRFKITKKGKIKHRAAYRNHILSKKSTKRKRQLRGISMASKCHLDSIMRLLKLK